MDIRVTVLNTSCLRFSVVTLHFFGVSLLSNFNQPRQDIVAFCWHCNLFRYSAVFRYIYKIPQAFLYLLQYSVMGNVIKNREKQLFPMKAIEWWNRDKTNKITNMCKRLMALGDLAKIFWLKIFTYYSGLPHKDSKFQENPEDFGNFFQEKLRQNRSRK